MKCTGGMGGNDPKPSRPVRGAWIEILRRMGIGQSPASRPVRGAWIEIVEDLLDHLAAARRAP